MQGWSTDTTDLEASSMNIFKNSKLKFIIANIMLIIACVLAFLALFFIKIILVKIILFSIAGVLGVIGLLLNMFHYCPYCHYYNFRNKFYKCRCKNCGAELKDDPDYKYQKMIDDFWNRD